MRLVYFGSGAFGLPTLRQLIDAHNIALIVTQPDRPAGRHRTLTPTPVAQFAAERNLPTIKPEQVNDAAVVRQVRDLNADAFVVIAFGQKLGPALLESVFAINLHGSLLPKYRGAAPIQRAMMEGERETGVSVIGVIDRMDAGPIYGQAATLIDPLETAGELHGRLANLGPEVMLDVLSRRAEDRLIPQEQDERQATRAPKLTKAEGTVQFDQPADLVRARIHGLTPWPGCTVRITATGGTGVSPVRGGAGQASDRVAQSQRLVRLARVQVVDEKTEHSIGGMVLDDFSIACSCGAIRPFKVQPPGGKLMTYDAYRNGQPVTAGMRFESP